MIRSFKVSYRAAEKSLKVSPSTLNRLMMGKSNIMDLRLSKAFARSPKSWLSMQDRYDLWQAKQRVNLDEIEKLASA